MSRTLHLRRWPSSWWSRGGARALALTLLPSVIVNATAATSPSEFSYPLLLVSAINPTPPQQNVEPSSAPVSGAPCNLRGPVGHSAFIAMIWQRSRTFRRQCVRLSAEPRLVVRVHTAATWSNSRGRAGTQLQRRSNGMLEADLHLSARSASDFVELIAHEFEHVIEQLDGVDLARAARLAPQLVWAPTSDRFETTRAIEMGRIVAAEVKRGTP